MDTRQRSPRRRGLMVPSPKCSGSLKTSRVAARRGARGAAHKVHRHPGGREPGPVSTLWVGKAPPISRPDPGRFTQFRSGRSRGLVWDSKEPGHFRWREDRLSAAGSLLQRSLGMSKQQSQGEHSHRCRGDTEGRVKRDADGYGDGDSTDHADRAVEDLFSGGFTLTPKAAPQERTRSRRHCPSTRS